MSKSSTQRTQLRPRHGRGENGTSERLLLMAIVLLGVVGLAVSYTGRSVAPTAASASAGDTVSSDGELRGDHMILHLNQRTSGVPREERVSRF